VPIEPEQVARELDDWVLRHREPLDPINGSTPSPTASSGCTLHWN
jgi:hypothetical protein